MEEPYLTFRKVVEDITKNVGGNMEGFVLLYATKRGNLPNPPEKEEDREKIAFGGGGTGEPLLSQQLHLVIAANIVEAFLPQCRGNLYIAMEVVKAKILEVLVAREKTRRP
jgi:hypothetical protein